jgi:hypothetical protein
MATLGYQLGPFWFISPLLHVGGRAMPASLHRSSCEMIHARARRIASRRILGRASAGAILLCLIAGCVAPQMVRCPLEDADLTKKILAIAPIGTPRDETIRKLKAAGIAGAFGSERSAFGKDYYCCQAWRHSQGEVWKISLLLHFDKDGNFCETLDLPSLDPTPTKSRSTRGAS